MCYPVTGVFENKQNILHISNFDALITYTLLKVIEIIVNPESGKEKKSIGANSWTKYHTMCQSQVSRYLCRAEILCDTEHQDSLWDWYKAVC